jgi:uncharacterized protein YkwD
MKLRKLSLVIAISTLITFSPLNTIFAQSASGIIDNDANINKLITKTNNTRVDNSLPSLATSSKLMQAAQLKAENMASKGYFAHTSPDGLTPWHWFYEVGYKARYAGENLALAYSLDSDIVKSWMNSPTHKKNLLGKNYEETGIGIAKGKYNGRDAYFIVQVFGTLND